MIRLAIDIFLLITVFILPWWLWIFLVLPSVFFINRQYEFLFLAFLADAAYGDGGFFLLLITAVLLILSIFLRPHLNINERF